MDIKAELQKIKSYLMSSENVETTSVAFANYAIVGGGEVKIEGEIAVGSAVSIMDDSGNEVPAPDGDYTLDGVANIKVVGGSITEITPIAEEEPATEPTEVEVEVEQSADTTALPEYVNEQPIDTKKMQEMADRLVTCESMISELMAKVESMTKANTAMTAVIEEMSKAPTAEVVKPAQFSFINKKEDVYSRLEKLKNSINK
jgi:hypothetical protein